ncbi:hypothetical protein ACSYGW_06080 [Bacillus glycinifermentans]|nr:hypothetical protein [Bacillus glycinifermentans]MEC3606520.1 hypothetical protein [Bacillus glycinifermentans]
MTLKEVTREDLKNRIFHWPDIQEFREEEATNIFSMKHLIL